MGQYGERGQSHGEYQRRGAYTGDDEDISPATTPSVRNCFVGAYKAGLQERFVPQLVKRHHVA